MKKVRIAPSILAWDLSDLGRAVEIADEGGADQVHLDVIDGHFAPNITFGPGTVKALRGKTDLPFDTHLMVENPELYAGKFIDSGSDILTVHAEVMNEERFDSFASEVARKGKKVGLALKPSTTLPTWAHDRLDRVSTLVVMTVNPGFSGQRMDEGVLPKLAALSEVVREMNLDTDVEVDGGVEPDNAREVVKRGCNVLVAGAGVYAKPDPAKAIGILRERATEVLTQP
jgi:ribulose-phosphate 3-epimerase